MDFIRHGLLLQFGPHHNLIERTTIERYHEDAFDLHGRGEYANELRWNVAKNSVANGRNSGAQNADLDADGFGIGNTNHGCSGAFNWIHHNDVLNSFGGIRISGEFETASVQTDDRDGQTFTGSHYQLVEDNTIDGCRFGFRCEQLAGQFLSVRNNTFRDSDGDSNQDSSPVTALPASLRFDIFRAIDIDESFTTAANSQILANNCIAWTDGQLTGSGFPRNAQEAIFIVPPNGGDGIDALSTQNGNTISGFPATPSDDTYVRIALPDDDFGTETQLRVAGSSNTHIVFLKFDLSRFPDGGTVNAARLTLFSSAAENPAVMHNLYLIADDPNIASDDQTWSQDTLTWENSDTLRDQGQLGVSLMNTLTAHLDPVNFNLDLSSQAVQDEIEKALGGILTLRLEADPEFVNYIAQLSVISECGGLPPLSSFTSTTKDEGLPAPQSHRTTLSHLRQSTRDLHPHQPKKDPRSAKAFAILRRPHPKAEASLRTPKQSSTSRRAKVHPRPHSVFRKKAVSVGQIVLRFERQDN